MAETRATHALTRCQSCDMVSTSPSAALFDRWSATYDRTGLQLFTYRPIHDAVLAQLDGLEPSTVVDLGCGTGQLTQRLMRRFPDADIVGVDVSDGMLTEAAGRLRQVGGDAQPLVRAEHCHRTGCASCLRDQDSK